MVGIFVFSLFIRVTNVLAYHNIKIDLLQNILVLHPKEGLKKSKIHHSATLGNAHMLNMDEPGCSDCLVYGTGDSSGKLTRVP